MKLTIGQFNDSFPPIIDGVANVVLNYARCLNNDKSTCCVVTPKHPDAADDYSFDVHRFASIKVPTRSEYRVGVPQMSTSFWMTLKKIPFDIVHAHCPFSSGLAARSIARKRDIPLVATFHSKFKDDFKAAIKSERIVDNILLKIAGFYESADEVWIVNEASEEPLREYGYRGDVYIMGNGCDIEPQYPTPEILKKVNDKFSLSPDIPLFMYIGQHTWQKNLQMVMEALGKLKAEGERFHMLFVGDGAKRAEMEQMSVDLNLTDSVTFAGRIYDRKAIAKIYLRSSAMLFPSLYDTSSLVPREAAACGCPTVFVKGASTSQGITDKNGFLIENTADSLANAVRRIIQHPEEAKRVGEAARETVYRSWQNAVEDAYERYLYLIDMKKSRLEKRAE